ncbi:MAG: hypothetical protein HUU19_12065 [Phycisphaerales bacterium]|nr:hypothetical protein [Phycisphaerales bacterium]
MRELYAWFMVFYVPVSLCVFALAYVAGWVARGVSDRETSTPSNTTGGAR